ncbi:hypothetical protein BDV39DRAFT_171118, partial [Aspergillus sergii]
MNTITSFSDIDTHTSPASRIAILAFSSHHCACSCPRSYIFCKHSRGKSNLWTMLISADRMQRLGGLFKRVLSGRYEYGIGCRRCHGL